MEPIIAGAVIAIVVICAYRNGKKLGSRKGFHAGRRSARRRRRRR